MADEGDSQQDRRTTRYAAKAWSVDKIASSRGTKTGFKKKNKEREREKEGRGELEKRGSIKEKDEKHRARKSGRRTMA